MITDCKSLKVLYLSLFYPHLDYCCDVWGNSYKSNIQCLFLLQKNVIRKITHSDYLANTNVFLTCMACHEYVYVYHISIVYHFSTNVLIVNNTPS